MDKIKRTLNIILSSYFLGASLITGLYAFYSNRYIITPFSNISSIFTTIFAILIIFSVVYILQKVLFEMIFKEEVEKTKNIFVEYSLLIIFFFLAFLLILPYYDYLVCNRKFIETCFSISFNYLSIMVQYTLTFSIIILTLATIYKNAKT